MFACCHKLLPLSNNSSWAEAESRLDGSGMHVFDAVCGPNTRAQLRAGRLGAGGNQIAES